MFSRSNRHIAVYCDVAIQKSARRKYKTPPEDTGQEALYLRSLSERRISIVIKLRDGETVTGWIEYFDDQMIRLTREGHPNLFIYKTQILTFTEQGKRGAARKSASEDATA